MLKLCYAVQDSIRFFFGSKKQSYGLADILPQRFGPADLLSDPNTPLLLQPQHNSIELTSGNPHSLHCGVEGMCAVAIKHACCCPHSSCCLMVHRFLEAVDRFSSTA